MLAHVRKKGLRGVPEDSLFFKQKRRPEGRRLRDCAGDLPIYSSTVSSVLASDFASS
jgi:hypothetical protein